MIKPSVAWRSTYRQTLAGELLIVLMLARSEFSAMTIMPGSMGLDRALAPLLPTGIVAVHLRVSLFISVQMADNAFVPAARKISPIIYANARFFH